MTVIYEEDDFKSSSNGGTQENQWYWFEGNLGGEGTDV